MSKKTDGRPTTLAEMLADAVSHRDDPRHPDTREELQARLDALTDRQRTD